MLCIQKAGMWRLWKYLNTLTFFTGICCLRISWALPTPPKKIKILVQKQCGILLKTIFCPKFYFRTVKIQTNYFCRKTLGALLGLVSSRVAPPWVGFHGGDWRRFAVAEVSRWRWLAIATHCAGSLFKNANVWKSKPSSKIF